MENYFRPGTRNEPNVNLDSIKGLIEIKGRSILEHSTEFYDAILEWIKIYLQNPAEETTIVFHLEYYNSSSKKFLLDILEKFTPLFNNGKKVIFKWYYPEEDEEEKEAGELYGELSGLPVQLIEVAEE